LPAKVGQRPAGSSRNPAHGAASVVEGVEESSGPATGGGAPVLRAPPDDWIADGAPVPVGDVAGRPSPPRGNTRGARPCSPNPRPPVWSCSPARNHGACHKTSRRPFSPFEVDPFAAGLRDYLRLRCGPFVGPVAVHGTCCPGPRAQPGHRCHDSRRRVCSRHQTGARRYGRCAPRPAACTASNVANPVGWTRGLAEVSPFGNPVQPECLRCSKTVAPPSNCCPAQGRGDRVNGRSTASAHLRGGPALGPTPN